MPSLLYTYLSLSPRSISGILHGVQYQTHHCTILLPSQSHPIYTGQALRTHNHQFPSHITSKDCQYSHLLTNIVMNRLDSQVLVQSCTSQLTSDTRRLESSERYSPLISPAQDEEREGRGRTD
jgi:hypothetical protein